MSQNVGKGDITYETSMMREEREGSAGPRSEEHHFAHRHGQENKRSFLEFPERLEIDIGDASTP
jgi:hypothetical protein